MAGGRPLQGLLQPQGPMKEDDAVYMARIAEQVRDARSTRPPADGHFLAASGRNTKLQL